MISIFNKIDIFKRALDFAWKRNEVISDNIANADTPGYKAKDLNFQTFMKNYLTDQDDIELLTTDKRHMSKDETSTDNMLEIVDSGNEMRLDGNSVDVEQEMGKLIKNSLYFDGVSLQLNRELNKWKNVIKEGR